MSPAADNPFLGEPVTTLPTPALVADIDLLSENLRLLADYFAERPCQIRPHFKSHKCVELARRQLAAGSCSGITCAKLSEAEQLVAGGIQDVLIANQVIGHEKALRLAKLNEQAVVRCAVEAPVNIEQLGAASNQTGVTIPVLVEVDIGMRRCGVSPQQAALELARQVISTPGLRFDGLQGYEGHMANVTEADKRREGVRKSMALLVATRRELEQAGVPCAIVTGGSSATYDVTGNTPGVDEVQCGSYALMDAKYLRTHLDFKIARWILATAISVRDQAVVMDVGLKGIGSDMGLPMIADHPAATARFLAEEHATFDQLSAQVGDKFFLVPRHGCTTHHLYRELWIAREGVVLDRWEIEGAGCLQ